MTKAAELAKYYDKEIFLSDKSYMAWFKYDSKERELHVVFRSGKHYKYTGLMNGNFHQVLLAKNRTNYIFNNIMKGRLGKNAVRMAEIPPAIIDRKVLDNKQFSHLAR